MRTNQYMYVYTFVTHVNQCVHMFTPIYTLMYLCIICIHMYIYIYIYMYVFMCECDTNHAAKSKALSIKVTF